VASKQNPIYAQLAKKKSKKKCKNAYNVAVGDWLKAPVIDIIEWREGHISVLASDDVMVTKVTVTVVGEAGQRLEQSEAKLSSTAWWKYQTTHKGLVRVEAWDLASNVTRQEFYSPTESSWEWEKTP